MKKKNGGARARLRNREMLLPLSAAIARRISLENHLALATVKAGSGTPDTMIALLRVLYMTYFLVEEHISDAQLDAFLAMEAAMDDSIRQFEENSSCNVSPPDLPLIEKILLEFDNVISSVPKYHYVDAYDKFHAFARSPDQSPLPGSRVSGIWE
jgi:hypothetical protein